MKRIINLLFVCLLALATHAQSMALEQLKTDPRKAYGTDYPYPCKAVRLTKSPRGYKPFYISHYGRHGSRYYWREGLYKEIDTLLTTAHDKHLLTAAGEAFRVRFTAVKDELTACVTELSDLGWEQHQYIARTMYDNFTDVFKHGGNILAISSLSGRCVISMAAFCQELTQCNPRLEIREQSSRKTLDGVVPQDTQNPLRQDYPKSKPRYESNRSQFHWDNTLHEKVIQRMFTSTDGLDGNIHRHCNNLIDLYKSLPSIGHEGMMDGILTDEDIAAVWEGGNLDTYSWVFAPRYEMIPILRDIIRKADDVVCGNSDRIADLRFGHDSCLGPLTILMGINGSDSDPENPYEVKDCYQNWMTCKASNLQLVFYRGKKGQDVLVKCLLNGSEATLPVPTDNYPYYKWSDFKKFYGERMSSF